MVRGAAAALIGALALVIGPASGQPLLTRDIAAGYFKFCGLEGPKVARDACVAELYGMWVMLRAMSARSPNPVVCLPSHTGAYSDASEKFWVVLGSSPERHGEKTVNLFLSVMEAAYPCPRR